MLNETVVKPQSETGIVVPISVHWLDYTRNMSVERELTQATSGSAGVDLRAMFSKPIVMAPMSRVIIPLGFSLHIPKGFEVQLRARSGLAYHYGIGLTNGLGTIDADYRGELKVMLSRFDPTVDAQPYTITPGERVCQMVLSNVDVPLITNIYTEDVTEEGNSRGTGGFGSTGK